MLKSRVYNFGAGPATLPESLLTEARDELLDWQGLGMSVMELSHRDKHFTDLLSEAEHDLRELLSIPKNYRVIFLGTPARFQFVMVAMNFLVNRADYLISGTWSKMAFNEATKIGSANLCASNADSNYLALPKGFEVSPLTDYLYYTPNETLTGLKINSLPDFGAVPIVADMTSCILSEPVDVNNFGLIFAGSQKNIAPAGLSLVIVADSLLEKARTGLPSYLDYRVHVKNGSNYATPPSFTVYMAYKMFKWLKAKGGVESMAKLNQEKASLLYQCIDEQDFYHCPIEKEARSMMNVAFRLADDTLNDKFLALAKQRGLVALKGHRSIGGMRASIYNAMPIEGVRLLCDFMKEFAQSET